MKSEARPDRSPRHSQRDATPTKSKSERSITPVRGALNGLARAAMRFRSTTPPPNTGTPRSERRTSQPGVPDQWITDMEKLLHALAEKLPANAGRSTVELAFRSAVDALPKSKIRDELLLKQTRLIGRLRSLLPEGDAPGDPAACFQGVDINKPGDCIKHCQSLLQDALVSLDPAARSEEALAALVALFPPESGPWRFTSAGSGLVELTDQSIRLESGDLEALVQMLPCAATALGTQNTIAWRRFLGLCVAAPLRLTQDAPTMKVVERLACTAAVLATAPAARTAVRIATASASLTSVSQSHLACLVPALLPLLRIGFLKGSCDSTRGDLLALLGGLRVLRLTRSKTPQFSEMRQILTAALLRDFDATPLDHKGSLRRGKALLKKLKAAEAKTSSAAVTVELVEALAEVLQPSELARLVSFSGLPCGEDEEVDAKAAAARARGDLFFEDTAGDVPLESLLAGGSESAHQAQAQVSLKLQQAQDLQAQRSAGSRLHEIGLKAMELAELPHFLPQVLPMLEWLDIRRICLAQKECSRSLVQAVHHRYLGDAPTAVRARIQKLGQRLNGAQAAQARGSPEALSSAAVEIMVLQQCSSVLGENCEKYADLLERVGFTLGDDLEKVSDALLESLDRLQAAPAPGISCRASGGYHEDLD
eukprot:g28405.t1